MSLVGIEPTNIPDAKQGAAEFDIVIEADALSNKWYRHAQEEVAATKFQAKNLIGLA